MPRPAAVLTGVLFGAAIALSAGGLVLATDLPAGAPSNLGARFGLAAALMVAAQLARLRLRVAPAPVSVTWGETALIIGLYLVPTNWLPAATLVGVGLAWALLSVVGDQRTALEVAHVAATLTVAVSLAAAVVAAVGAPFDAAPTPAGAAALIAGSLTYLLASAGLTALTLSLRHRLPVTQSLSRVLGGKLLMFVGNVTVGLAAVAMLDDDPRWLLLTPPVLWLLQQTYRYRLRADRERRAWLEYAEATRMLNRLDVHEVAIAGVGGALTLCGAERVDLDVTGTDGRSRRYRGDTSGVVIDNGTDEAQRAGREEVVTCRLAVGAVRVGELRVHPPRSVLLGPGEHAALSAFGAALATALHGAAAHRDRTVLTARSSYAAVHDPLTDLLNRPALLGQGDGKLRQLDHGHPVALLLLDLDNFGEVNETLGHNAGDELLKLTADRLRTATRPGELLARLGGDEFALLITSLSVAGGPAALADRPSPMPYALSRAREVVELLSGPVEVAGVRMSAGASIGVVVAGAGAADLGELLRRADSALRQAKETSSSVVSYDSAADAANTDQLMLLGELREALAVDDQLVLALQPAVDLTTGAPTGVEALVRWRHPRRGKLNPVDFVRVVEGSDLLGPFTRYVIDNALAVAADWSRHGLAVPISVNLSPRSLLDPRLPADVAELLRRHGVPAQRLVLEITETVVLSELDVIDEVLGGLRALGVQLAVDDFGTGFSSLTLLTRITVDELKVDRSFVTRMTDSPRAAAVVRATVQLGRDLDLRVVAEGVETAEQRLALAELGCTAAQGYHFFRPMPPDTVMTVLRSLLDSAPAQVYPLRADGA